MKYLVYLWLFVSSIYYIGPLFEGAIIIDVNEGVAHKAFKYVIALIISTWAIAKVRSWGVFSFLAIILSAALIIYASSPVARPLADVYVVFGSMFGLIFLLRALDTVSLQRLPFFIVLTGVVVGVFSIIEIFYLGHLFRGHWESTGGMRSMSTLFNPNNHGLYMAACSILLITTKIRLSVKALLFIPIAFGLILSGSRTAWAGFLFVSILMFFHAALSNQIRVKCSSLFVGVFGFVIASSVSVFLMVLDSSVLQSSTAELRRLDFETASIRLERYKEYIGRADEMMILPDYLYRNGDVISENSYFVLINSFGLLGVFFLFLYFMLAFRLNVSDGLLEASRWRWLIFFYLFVGVADNTINSFPNNQLFFIALGAILCSRGMTMREPASG